MQSRLSPRSYHYLKCEASSYAGGIPVFYICGSSPRMFRPLEASHRRSSMTTVTNNCRSLRTSRLFPRIKPAHRCRKSTLVQQVSLRSHRGCKSRPSKSAYESCPVFWPPYRSPKTQQVWAFWGKMIGSKNRAKNLAPKLRF